MHRKMAAFAVAPVCAVLASVAFGASTETVTSTASANKAGSKSKPAPFAARFDYAIANDDGTRPPTPSSWTWKWSGVHANGAQFPTCSADDIDAAQSDAGCPKGSLVASGPVEAQAGPETDPTSNFSCTGKVLRIYNAGAKAATLFIVGPPEGCGGIGYIAPAPVTVTTKGATTSMKLVWPQNMVNPLPGIKATLNKAQLTFKKMTTGSGRKKVSYLASTSCSGRRTFSLTVVGDGGTTTSTANAGRCG